MKGAGPPVPSIEPGAGDIPGIAFPLAIVDGLRLPGLADCLAFLTLSLSASLTASLQVRGRL